MWDCINKDAHWFQSVPWFNGNYLKNQARIKNHSAGKHDPGSYIHYTIYPLYYLPPLLFTPFTIYPFY